MGRTKIEWTRGEDGSMGMSWNFIRGCSRVSEGCRHCYAETVAHRFNGPGLPYEGLTVIGGDGEPRWNGKITFHEDILLKPLHWKKPRKIFVNSMSDLFHENVSFDIIDKAFAVMALTPQHTYQILTKRPERMREYMMGVGIAGEITGRSWRIHEAGHAMNVKISEDVNFAVPIRNIWLGVSVEDQKTADERIPILLNTPAACHWISAEPLLGPIDLRFYLSNFWRTPSDKLYDTLNWVVVGGESGAGARPCDVNWIKQIIKDCKSAGCSVFVKQMGSLPIMGEEVWKNNSPLNIKSSSLPRGFVAVAFTNKKGGDIEEWPEDLRIREYPEVRR